VISSSLPKKDDYSREKEKKQKATNIKHIPSLFSSPKK
jgi:hypothetical protein